MKPKLLILIIIFLVFLNGCINKSLWWYRGTILNESKVYLISDKEEYYTNLIVFEGVRIRIFNNLNQSIYYLTGCAVEHLHKYKYENGSLKRVFLIKSGDPVCAAMPFINELEPNNNAPLGMMIKEPGKYKLSLSYSLETEGRWKLGATKEVFSNTFEIKYIKPTMDNSLEICNKSAGFTDGSDLYYPYESCLQSVADWIAQKNPERAIELCNNIPDPQCYSWIAQRIVKVDYEKAKYACSKAKDYTPDGFDDFRELCLNDIEEVKEGT